MDRGVFDASFKRMAIDLSYARGSVKEVADELGIDPGRLSKWWQKDSSPVRSTEGLTDEQREIKRPQIIAMKVCYILGIPDTVWQLV